MNRETIRTIILLVLLAIALGFIYWVSHQSESTLGSSAPASQTQTETI